MKRLAVLLAALISLSPAPDQSVADKVAKARADYGLLQERSIQINELAGHVRSLEDARRMVDLTAEIFADDLPPSWATRSIRERIAKAEYESASDHAKLIPEQRVADAWNRYMTTIGAAPDAIVTAAEIHNLRDGSYSVSRVLWNRGSRTIWTAPNLYAIDREGKVADGCTAFEALRVLYDLTREFRNLQSARERVRKGVLISDTRKPAPDGAAQKPTVARLESYVAYNPAEDAGNRYAREHGMGGLNEAIEQLLDDLFPS